MTANQVLTAQCQTAGASRQILNRAVGDPDRRKSVLSDAYLAEGEKQPASGTRFCAASGAL